VEPKTYYMILGVPQTESPAGIRAAYRDLVRKFHPDVAGEQATRVFQELSEAYAVLSDPGERRAYNRTLERAQPAAPPASVVQVDRPARVRAAVSVGANPESIRPSFDAMVERFLRNFTGIGAPKSERAESLNFDLFLSPDEVAQGCVVPVGVPALVPCPRCGGAGREWLVACGRCRQQGIVESEKAVELHLPAMVPSGAVLEFSLDDLGIRNFYVRVHVLHD
jgi:DnaJ-class molecular chaperone